MRCGYRAHPCSGAEEVNEAGQSGSEFEAGEFSPVIGELLADFRGELSTLIAGKAVLEFEGQDGIEGLLEGFVGLDGLRGGKVGC